MNNRLPDPKSLEDYFFFKILVTGLLFSESILVNVLAENEDYPVYPDNEIYNIFESAKHQVERFLHV